jgi:hypothetical protein
MQRETLTDKADGAERGGRRAGASITVLSHALSAWLRSVVSRLPAICTGRRKSSRISDYPFQCSTLCTPTLQRPVHAPPVDYARTARPEIDVARIGAGISTTKVSVAFHS